MADCTSMRRGIVICLRVMSRFILILFSVVTLVGCEKINGEAVVLEKEHIATAVPGETPDLENSDGASGALADDEIAVDSYVMKKEVRGTGRDPRAQQHEQWIVKVRMISDGRTFNVPADQTKFDKLSKDDRVQIGYRIGKYTKTVWGARSRKVRDRTAFERCSHGPASRPVST